MMILSTDTIRLEYLAEGAANVVYRIFPPSSSLDHTEADLHFSPDVESSTTPPPSEIEPLELDPVFSGKLVRLRKTSSTVSVAETQRHFVEVIKPRFLAENLVQTTLMQLSPDLLRRCNADLRQLEASGKRPEIRRGTYLAEDERYGALVTDMTCSSYDGSGHRNVEFKPKWLAVSPSAPVDSRRCRTCALTAMKAVKSEGLPTEGFCPLSLVTGNRHMIQETVDRIVGSNNPNGEQLLRRRLTDFLYQNPLLRRLRDLQVEFDPDGPLTADLANQRFLAAMTLRDCTLFLKVG